MLARAVKLLILLVGVVLVIYPLADYARETTKVLGWARSGSLGSDIRTLSGSERATFRSVDPEDFPHAPLPAAGDTLLTVIDSTGVSLSAREALNRPAPSRGTWRFVFARASGAGTDTATVALQPQSRGDLLAITGLEIVRVLIYLGYLLVGLYAFALRSDSGGVRALTLFSFAMAAMMTTGVHVLPDYFAAFQIPGHTAFGAVSQILTMLFGAFWLNLAVLFPQPLPIVARRPLLTHVFIYALSGLIVLLGLTGWGGRQIAVMAIVSASVWAGFFVLGVRRGRATDALERRQLTLVLFGTGPGLGMLFLLVLLGIIPGLMERLPERTVLGLIILNFLTLLISPISFAYAFGRFRLLEVEGFLRRGTRFAAVTAVVLAAFGAALVAFNGILLRVLQVEDRTPTLAVAMLSAFAFLPAVRRSQSWVEHRFYPERARLRALLNELLSATAVMPDRAALWDQLELRLRAGLGISKLIVLLQEEGEGFHAADGELVPIDSHGALESELKRSRRPLMVDELRASEHVPLQPAEERYLQEQQIALLIPMHVGDRLAGVLALAFDQTSEALAAQELALLGSVASQIGLQSENLRLLEENLEKRHFEEQLATARRVQERFLPKVLPATPGLEMAACCIFSLEVAGDYYDVIPLEDERTLLAVGDVAGKGAGAAMIMANVQASLRALSGVHVELGQAVGRLNEVIHGNTELDQFITFFAGLYDPAERQLTYVNAGHNPPRVIRANGETETLEIGGPILGVLPAVPFEQGTIRLEPGDILLGFTDGVSEAVGAEGEQFGEDRIADLVRAHSGEGLEQVVEHIREAVEAFSGSSAFADDFTLLIARVN